MVTFHGRKSFGSPHDHSSDTPTSNVVAHVWHNYVPDTFVEPHPYLIAKTNYDSINLVSNLWNNGRQVDQKTFSMKTHFSKNLVEPTFFFKVLNRITRWLEWIRFNSFCIKQTNQNKISVVHSHFGTTGCEMKSFLKKVNRPHIVTFYGYDGSAALQKKAIVEKYKDLFQNVSLLIVLCETVRQRMIALGCDSQKIKVWNMPAGIEKYPYVKREPRKSPRFITAARFAESKGHPFLLEAFAMLLKRGYSASLTLVGYGHHCHLIKDRIRELNIQNSVTIINTELVGDFTEQYKALLNEHDVFVLPSIEAKDGTDESGPALTLVCAQAAGLPVICTPFPGSEISVIHGETGLFCEEKNSQSLFSRMEDLILNQDKWNILGRNGSELVKERFSESIQMNELIEIYDEVISNA